MKQWYRMVESNWADVLKDVDLVLFNEYPNIVSKLEAWDDEPMYADNIEEDEDGYTDEVFQWYIAGISDSMKEYIEDITDGAIKFHWSELMGNYILPVHHFGTGWSCVPVEVKEFGWSEEVPEGATEVSECL